MPEMPFAVTGLTLEEVKSQINELLRTLFEDRIGGYERTLLDGNKILSLDSSKEVVSTEVAGYADGVLGTSPIVVTDNGDGTITVAWSPSMTSWVAGTANQITVNDDGDGTITLSLPQNFDMTALEGLIYFAGGRR